MSPTPAGLSACTVYIDPELHEQLRAAAFWNRVTKGSIVDAALRAYLADLDIPDLPAGTAPHRGRRPKPTDSAESPPPAAASPKHV